MAETDDTGTGTAEIAPEPKLEPKVDDARVASRQPAKGRSALLPILGGVLAALAGFGVAQLVPNSWPLGNTSTLQAQLTSEISQVDALKAKILELGQRLDSSNLADRIAKLEAAPGIVQF